MTYNGFSIDIEADGFVLESTQIWVLCLRDLDTGEKLKLNPFKQPDALQRFEQWCSKYDTPNIIFHNGLGYDIFVLHNILGVPFTVGADTIFGKPCLFVDTFYLSMYLNPDRDGHSLESFGARVGITKIDFRQALIEAGALKEDAPEGEEFKQYHVLMDTYCERDTLVGDKTFKFLLGEWVNLYGDWDHKDRPAHYKCGQKSFFLMSCQELTGWKFDAEKGEALMLRIDAMMEELRASVEPQLPLRGLKKAEEQFYRMPAKPFKKDGTYSATWEKFVAKHQGIHAEDTGWVFYGKPYKIIAGSLLDVKLPMEMANQDQMKEWLLECGWKPTLWNYQKDSNGKPMRDPVTRKFIQTSPKLQETGKLCPNLEAMEGDLIKQVVKWLSLRNRQSVLRSWLDNPRLKYDGRIGAGRTGIASTHRQKHKVVVNVPKADPKVLLGYEFRDLWGSEDGFLIAAADAAALEGRVQGHYCFKYDNGATAKELLDGDVHSKNCMAFYGDIYPKVASLYKSPDFDKENPEWKPYRSKSKNGYYAIMYGAAAPKVASTLGIPETHGKRALDAFWEANPGTAELKTALETYWQTTGKSKYLPAIDGRVLLTRKKSALLNTIFQSCGGIAMDYACCFMDRWLGGIKFDDLRRPYYLYKGAIVRRIGYFHDEVEFECEACVAEEVSTMMERAIKVAGEHLKIKIPLAGEGKVGKTWKETH